MIAAPPATLLGAFLDIVAPWRDVFPQRRTYRRAVRQAVGSLLCLGRRCLSRIIWTNGGQHRSWSAEYFLHSRCHWDPQALFHTILTRARPLCRGRLVGVAVDDTRVRKTGRCIPQAAYHRDPLSPPFHVNLIRAVRFLGACGKPARLKKTVQRWIAHVCGSPSPSEWANFHPRRNPLE